MAEPQRASGPEPRPDVSTAGAAARWEPASLQRRFGALVLDWVLCLLIAGFFGPLIRNPWPSVLLVVEYAFFVGLFTQTPGMWTARIRCISVRDGSPIGIPRAALRGLLLALVLPALLLDRYQRGWHDKASGSIVVSATPVGPARATGTGDRPR